VSGEALDPLAFSRRVGLLPTHVTRKGEPRPSGRGSYPLSTWSLSFTQHSRSTDPAVRELLDALEPVKSALDDFKSANPSVEMGVICTVTVSDEPVSVELLPSTLDRLGSLGYPIVFDVHDYS
jgi:hypothetical protein